MTRRLALVGACILTLILNLQAGETRTRSGLRLGDRVDLPTLGIRFRVFRDFGSRPPKTASAYTYVVTRTGEHVEAYAPLDLWRRDHTEAVFFGEEGRISVAQVYYKIPKELPLIGEGHVQEEDYIAARTKEVQAADNWTLQELTKWVEVYTGLHVERADTDNTNTGHLLCVKS